MHLTVVDVESTLCILSVDRKREVSKLNVGVVLIIAIREISNRENEFDVNSRNIRPSKITRYTVCGRKGNKLKRRREREKEATESVGIQNVGFIESAQIRQRCPHWNPEGGGGGGGLHHASCLAKTHLSPVNALPVPQGVNVDLRYNIYSS